LLEKKVMPPRKAAPVAKPSNPFAVFAESDTEDEVVVEVIEKKPENRFESLVKEGVSPLVPSVLPFKQHKGRWMKAKIEPVEAGHDQPRSAHEWAERVRQSLEKAEGTPRVERLKDIRDSLTRLSFFRRPIEHLVSKEETSSTTVHA
jgi:hypothetical protein